MAGEIFLRSNLHERHGGRYRVFLQQIIADGLATDRATAPVFQSMAAYASLQSTYKIMLSETSCNIHTKCMPHFPSTAELFETLKPLLGEKSIQFANGQEGQARRRYYDDILNGDAVKQFFPQIQKVTKQKITPLAYLASVRRTRIKIGVTKTPSRKQIETKTDPEADQNVCC